MRQNCAFEIERTVDPGAAQLHALFVDRRGFVAAEHQTSQESSAGAIGLCTLFWLVRPLTRQRRNNAFRASFQQCLLGGKQFPADKHRTEIVERPSYSSGHNWSDAPRRPSSNLE